MITMRSGVENSLSGTLILEGTIRSPSINGQDVNGYTPLHHACLNGHYEIVRLLMIHDAAIDVNDIRGSTPLYLASWTLRNNEAFAFASRTTG
uniref:Uncharacterized protein n=1 Tax=Glossina brevipalpis TaxID=37001 RepID=A0A1A9W3M3_9MUSC